MQEYLQPTDYLDFEAPIIQKLVAPFRELPTPREQAVALYLRVRDGWRYNPYRISLRPDDFRASVVAARPDGHCVDKSVLYIAGLRALGIPARLHLGTVINHIAVERLTERFGTNELSPHGMVQVHLDGAWRKASPAFNKELCERCQVDPMDFDGKTDSVFQQYNRAGNRFMEYTEDFGTFADVPVEFMFQTMARKYPEVASQFKRGEVAEF